MAHMHDFVLGRLGKALRHHYDEIMREPLPQRWVELIRYLDEQEHKRTSASNLPDALSANRLERKQ
jgi:hypothetical protein